MDYLKMTQHYAENTIKNNMASSKDTIPSKNTIPSKDTGCCCCKKGCYKYDSTDTRCCGLCYCLCPAKNISKLVDKNRCDFCPDNFQEYLESGYFKTIDGPSDKDNCFCTTLCLPIKFPLFFPCFLGTLVNQCFNSYCCASTNQDRNYLC